MTDDPCPAPCVFGLHVRVRARICKLSNFAKPHQQDTQPNRRQACRRPYDFVALILLAPIHSVGKGPSPAPTAADRAIFSIGDALMQKTDARSRGKLVPSDIACFYRICLPFLCAGRPWRHCRRAAALRLFRTVVRDRTPMGRKAARHTEPGESARVHAAALGASTPRRLAL